jgi:hypothetical protein
MIRPLITSAVVALWFVANANVAFSQTNPGPDSVEANVTIFRYEPDGTLKSQSHRVSFTVSPIGKFSLGDTSVPGDCGPVPSQQVGTKVEGTVTPSSAGQYQIHLVISVRTSAGCRDVGKQTFPVFSNSTVTKDAVVASGETLSVPMGSRAGKDTLKVEVTLSRK